jgi:hypothetical protein
MRTDFYGLRWSNTGALRIWAIGSRLIDCCRLYQPPINGADVLVGIDFLCILLVII